MGQLVPVVFFPRFTSFCGANNFVTVGMDVTAYRQAFVNCWRGVLSGTTPTFAFSFEESTDQDSWSQCANGSGGDPGQNTEAQYAPLIAKRYFRVKLIQTGANVASTCWALGFLELHDS